MAPCIRAIADVSGEFFASIFRVWAFQYGGKAQQLTRRNIPEHWNFHQHRCQNLSYVMQTSLRASLGISTGFQCHGIRVPEINMDWSSFTIHFHLGETTLQTITSLHCFCTGQLCFFFGAPHKPCFVHRQPSMSDMITAHFMFWLCSWHPDKGDRRSRRCCSTAHHLKHHKIQTPFNQQPFWNFSH